MKILLSQSYSFCQKGRRDYQEDARWPDADVPLDSQRFFIVCDGVGGSKKGDVASKAVCYSLAKSMESIDLSEELSVSAFSEAFDEAYNHLDEISDDTNREMATTMVMVCFHSGGCSMIHIGDSRIYQFRKGEGIIYKSEDHSLVNKLVREGKLSPQEAENPPQGNVITRFMSPIEDDEERWEATFVSTSDIEPNDIFVLCTDGVTNCLTENHLSEILSSDIPYEDMVTLLSMECLNSTDNNTLILIPVKAVLLDTIALNETTGNSTQRLSRKPFTSIEVESEKKIENKGVFQLIKKWFNN